MSDKDEINKDLENQAYDEGHAEGYEEGYAEGTNDLAGERAAGSEEGFELGYSQACKDIYEEVKSLLGDQRTVSPTNTLRITLVLKYLEELAK